ncbi:MAG: hypothetical protein IPH23_05340 [Gammaproteobacteria bacterium]|nr:hypothetical protein [Gammaproteobacteria bacterium]
MEESAERGNYLLLSFKTPKEQEYIEFLWDAFEANCTHGKYQLAFLAYHRLALVSANRELIARFEKKIQATLARVWGEEESAARRLEP